MQRMLISLTVYCPMDVHFLAATCHSRMWKKEEISVNATEGFTVLIQFR